MATVRVAEKRPQAVDPAPEGLTAAQILADYELAHLSRQASLVGRREVMSGKAKFGIFGDGKELPQVAMAHAWRPGDFRSGYYRDQTLMLALGLTSLAAFFAQLYADADVERDPASAGRQMNCHFATRSLRPDGTWVPLTRQFNSSADLSPTGSQMPRLVGLAQASALYRALPDLAAMTDFSAGGNEVAWGMIGNATCAEGMFWEALNAAVVLQVPMVLSIWDDGYGISVPNDLQVGTGDLTTLLGGFQRKPGHPGADVRRVPGWDYAALVRTYREAAALARAEHVPTVIHVTELTQPQGHSTSGSHERYKSPERLAWEAEWDCLRQMRAWLIDAGLATADEADEVEARAARSVEDMRQEAWEAFLAPLNAERAACAEAIAAVEAEAPGAAAELRAVREELLTVDIPLRRVTLEAAHRAVVTTRGVPGGARQALAAFYDRAKGAGLDRYGSHLYEGAGQGSALDIAGEAPAYDADAQEVMGFEVVNACFDALLARDPRVVAFGEDVGRIGDVNQGFRGLQEKYGNQRVADTGIRETTILGQAIGLALRGLRPIAEVQYLDYLLYCLQVMSDDLATLHWRTAGGQRAPVIIRTRGHRLEGIWHSGSPMAGIVNLVHGIHVLVPRDMTRAAGFYNTLHAAEEPGLVVEVLNGYRVRERLPANIGSLRVPVGVAEILRAGSDVTVATYGACCRVVIEAAERLHAVGIDVEVVDVQSLLPFDRTAVVGGSLRKTGRIVFVDEDVPGGITALMLQQVLEGQQGYRWLDAEPRTLSAASHRPAYGSDGDYFSKPSAEDVFDAVYDLMNDSDPATFPSLI